MSNTKELKLFWWKIFPFPLATGVNDNGVTPWAANISENFRKYFKTVLRGYSGAWGELVYGKSKISWYCLFKEYVGTGESEERQLPGDHDEGLQEEGHHQELWPSGGYFVPSPAKNHATSYLFLLMASSIYAVQIHISSRATFYKSFFTVYFYFYNGNIFLTVFSCAYDCLFSLFFVYWCDFSVQVHYCTPAQYVQPRY